MKPQDTKNIGWYQINYQKKYFPLKGFPIKKYCMFTVQIIGDFFAGT